MGLFGYLEDGECMNDAAEVRMSNVWCACVAHFVQEPKSTLRFHLLLLMCWGAVLIPSLVVHWT